MAKDLTTTVYEPIQPEGLALSLMLVTIVFTVLSSVVVLLRFWIRQSHGLFSVEDWLMLAGWLLNLAHNAAVIVLSYSGIGSHDDVITVGMQFHIGLWTIIWQFLYVLDGALIKSSIIWTLLRLSQGVGVVYTRILWALFALGWIVWQISWPVAIFQCKPVAAAWGEPGDCTSGQTVILNVSYFVSAANIFTDFSTALVPIFLLRNLQMPRKLKLITMGILSLGVLASVATIIRISYTWAYTAPTERYYTIAKIVMLTVLECDLGIIAGSMPMLRHLLRLIAPSLADTDGTPERSRDVNLVTIGGSTGGKRTHMKLSKAAGASASDDHNHSEDKESTDDETGSRRHIMHATRQGEHDSVSDQGGFDNNCEVIISDHRLEWH
ncbi:GPCR, PTH11-type [Trichoderma longibrachiatum ATCC 18648]|uniref:GPCR, PTH11-type n=1 Tax=Trichoderma longibrachiatum ATCC 18648 TaxID=983965 RepID=A0A2T4C6F3_TRILO|nr:GPCR, PTH11-type [Trichoderma longibrachiatum ATCC 18648]